jgi:hypothetical protein
MLHHLPQPPPGIDPKAHYDNKVRQAVLDRILHDRTNVEATRQALHRDFSLDLSAGFVSDCLQREVQRLDMTDYRRAILERFSGTLCVDELYLGQSTLLLATDPVADLPVAFALVSRNDQGHMRRFLKNLKTWGFLPQVVITDGSDLYPAVLAEVWPRACHQLCVFHVLKNINEHDLDAVTRLRRGLARRGHRGRKRKRDRPSRTARARRRRRGLTNKDRAYFVFTHRYLIVKRRDHLSPEERSDLRTMLECLPQLQSLRTFVDRVHRLFEEGQSVHQAWCCWRALLKDQAFGALPELAKAMAMLSREKFAKMIAFLNSPLGRRARTNNHVERINRMVRFIEKVRSKWRRRRTLVRFMILRIHYRWPMSEVGDATEDSREVVLKKPKRRKAA